MRRVFMTGALGATTRRVTVAITIMILAIVGTTVFAATARAGGVDTNTASLDGAIYNLTPYTWTLVSANAPAACIAPNPGCYESPPSQTVAPGGGFVWQIGPNVDQSYLFSLKFGYDVYFTYRPRH